MSKTPPKLRNIDELSGESLMLLHRQWLRANLLRLRFQDAFRAEMGEKDQEKQEAEDDFDTGFFIRDAGVFMYLWYALLFSVLEGFRERDVDLSFLTELDEDLYQGLKVLRHTVFHVPRQDYWDSRMFGPMVVEDSVDRIFAVHRKIGLVIKMGLVHAYRSDPQQ
jgi:hypothetical protein